MKRMNVNAQSLMEYVILLSVATLVLVMMFPATKRGLQSVLKTTSDQLASQENAEQNFDENYLISSKTQTETFSDTIMRDQHYTTFKNIEEETKSETETMSYLGFQEDTN